MLDEIAGVACPQLADISAQRARLEPYIRTTPIFHRSDLPGLADTYVQFKLELFQVTGTFKARGAFSNLLALNPAQQKAGVTAFSAGNHAVAVAYAAMQLGLDAKVVMLKTANPARVALARQLGAEVLMADNSLEGFGKVEAIQSAEGRAFIHPFTTYPTVLGTSTLGAEWAQQAQSSDAEGLDAVILPIGGGGLAAGVARAFKLTSPNVVIYGAEPEGADVMAQSFGTGAPVRMAGPMHGIVDSLMAPHTEPYSFGLCHRHVDDLVTVNDDQVRRAMRLLFEDMKLAVEPACAVATAAALGPLRERIKGKRVGVLLCGSNTDFETVMRHLSAA
jgi:threonine dehydratase